MPQPSNRPFWNEILAPYAQPCLRRSVLQIVTSVVPYLALSVLMYLLLGAGVSDLIVLALAVPTAGFLVRTFILFHDCSHGSLMPSKRANAYLGAFLGLFVLSPFRRWRHDHAVHHASSGDLERRGVGDVMTLTVSEYRAKAWRGRLGYRMLRNPFVMFGLGPVIAMVVGPRIVSRGARPRMRNSVLAMDVTLVVIVGGLCWLMGWSDFLLVWGPAALLAGSTGIWLFYVQHQFEDTFWAYNKTWNVHQAALCGSSHYDLPVVLRWFTANIGVHHVHHLCSRIPFYRLPKALRDHPDLANFGRLTLLQSLSCVRLVLWDEAASRLISFGELRARLSAGRRNQHAAAGQSLL